VRVVVEMILVARAPTKDTTRCWPLLKARFCRQSLFFVIKKKREILHKEPSDAKGVPHTIVVNFGERGGLDQENKIKESLRTLGFKVLERFFLFCSNWIEFKEARERERETLFVPSSFPEKKKKKKKRRRF
jgi:hypothetical protein